MSSYILKAVTRRASPVVRRRIRFAWLAAATALLCACSVGPQFSKPAAPDVHGWQADGLPTNTVSSDVPGGDAQHFLVGQDVSSRWWSVFGNAELDRRIELSLTHSPTIASAQAALRQAQGNVDVARGPLWPSLDARAGAIRQQDSGAALDSQGVNVPLTPYTIYNASIAVGYTLDLFGANRRGVEAQAALADLARYQLQGTYLTLITNVVTASFREASLREQIAASEQIISLYGEQLDLVNTQYDIGVISQADVLVARAQIATARAQLPPLRKALYQTRNQLAVYMGQFPSEADFASLDLDALNLPQDIPVSLPSRLTQQRPDVLAAEAQLHQATAAVGVATANLFPQISLSGSYGSQALVGSDLFGSGTAAWSLGLNLLQPIFHGGELRARKRVAEAGLDRAVADYRSTVLTAFQNVADSLRALELDADALAAQADAAQAAQRSLDLVRVQYRDGATSYLQVLDSTRQYQQAHIGVIHSRELRLADTAALFAALGGGWRDAAAVNAASTGDDGSDVDQAPSAPPATGMGFEGAATSDRSKSHPSRDPVNKTTP